VHLPNTSQYRAFPSGPLMLKTYYVYVYNHTSLNVHTSNKTEYPENTSAWLKAKTIINFNGMNEIYSVIVTMWLLTHAHGLRSHICTWQLCAKRTILPSLNHAHANAALSKMMKTVAQSVRQVATIRIPQYLPFCRSLAQDYLQHIAA
jgi:hypothetical protein